MGIQYFPVDSINTSLQLFSASQTAHRRKSPVNLECFQERGIKDPTWDDYMDMDVDYGLGLPTLLQEVIEEAEGISLTGCDNYDGEKFLLYEPKYPWACPQAEKDLTPETLKTIFEKYIHILTDWKVKVCYHSVENGG